MVLHLRWRLLRGPPRRDVNGTDGDYPVEILNKGEAVSLECWKGNYYLVNYDESAGNPGHYELVIAADVAPNPEVPAACFNTDTPD